jgi:MtN3 and saliva related transmembrane protein
MLSLSIRSVLEWACTRFIRRFTHLTEFLGYFAGFLTTFCYIPQLMRVFKTRSTKDISLLFTSLVFVGCSIWLVYGIFLHQFPIILWNVITVILDGILIYAKLKFG